MVNNTDNQKFGTTKSAIKVHAEDSLFIVLRDELQYYYSKNKTLTFVGDMYGFGSMKPSFGYV